MSTEVEKTVKIVPFTSKSLWSIWSKQFLARAHIRGYRGILQGTTKVITKATKKGDLDVSVLRKLNQDAYNDLLLSFSDLVNFNLVDKACTNDLPDGDARQAWENLLNKHEPSSAATKVNLKMELSQSKMTDIKNDPDEWVTGLELLRIKLSKLKVKISDVDLIIHIINNLPDAYEAVCDQIENEMNDENRVFEVSLDMVKDRLRSKYLKMLRKTNLKHNAGKSTTFSEDAMYAGKYFKGKCHHCGKQGHKSVDCKDKKGNRITMAVINQSYTATIVIKMVIQKISVTRRKESREINKMNLQMLLKKSPLRMKNFACLRKRRMQSQTLIHVPIFGLVIVVLLRI